MRMHVFWNTVNICDFKMEYLQLRFLLLPLVVELASQISAEVAQSSDSMRARWDYQQQSLSCIAWLMLCLPMFEFSNTLQWRLSFIFQCTVRQYQQVISMQRLSDIQPPLWLLKKHLSIFDLWQLKKLQPFVNLEFHESLDQLWDFKWFVPCWESCS